MHDRLVPLHRRVVEQVARGEVIGAVNDDVVVGEDAIDVVAREALLITDDLHIGVERFQRLARGLGLWLADALRRMQDLSLEVRRVDDVGVDDAERPDAGRREVERCRRPEATRTDEQDLAPKELQLTGFAHFGDQEVAAVALRLLRRKARVGLLPGQPGVLPAVEAAGHRDDLGVAKLGERVGGHRGADAPGAVEDRGLVLVRDAVLRPLLDVALWQVDGAREMPFVPLVLLANVRELDVAGAK